MWTEGFIGWPEGKTVTVRGLEGVVVGVAPGEYLVRFHRSNESEWHPCGDVVFE